MWCVSPCLGWGHRGRGEGTKGKGKKKDRVRSALRDGGRKIADRNRKWNENEGKFEQKK